MKKSNSKEFVIYDYLSLNVNKEYEQLYVDCYQSFGWIFVSSNGRNENEDYFINNRNIYEIDLVNIKFKRDKKIKNKKELLSLQKKLELALKNIDKLTKEVDFFSTMCSISIGVIGLAFFTIAVILYIYKKNLLILSILNGIIGVVAFLLAYILYDKIKLMKQEKNEILIDEQYNIVYECCETANKLID